MTIAPRATSAGVAAWLTALALASAAAAQPVPPARLSVSTAGDQANGDSNIVAMSPDGRSILFVSDATNLVGGDTNGVWDLFVRDRDTDHDGVFDEPGAVSTVRVSSGLGGEQVTGSPVDGQMSRNGRFVLFLTSAALVGTDSNGVTDAYLRDRDTDGDGVFDEAGAVALTLVSTGNGALVANAAIASALMTDDGRYVLFQTAATNLIPQLVTTAQWYRKDLATGLTALVSRVAGIPGTGGAGSSAAISADGRYVVFLDEGLLPVGPIPPWVLYDFETNTTTLIATPSASSSTAARTAASPRDGVAEPLIGRYKTPSPGFASDGRTLYLSEGDFFIGAGPFSRSGSILEYDLGSRRVTAQIGGVAAGLDDTAILLYNRLVGTPCGSEQFVQFERYDRRTRRVTPLVAGQTGAVGASLGGDRLIFPDDDCGTSGPPNTYLLDLRYGTPLRMPALVRPGRLDEAGTMVIFDTADATVLDPGLDTNDTRDIFAVDLTSRFDGDADGLDDRWEVAMGLDYTSAAGLDGAAGDPDGDGATNLQEQLALTHPRGTAKQFLAEGADNAFFHTRIAIANPGATEATAVVRLDGDSGTARTVNVRVPPGARRTVFVDEIGAPSASFSTVVDANAPLVTERTMSWDASEYGAHAERATPSPSTTWFLAEGSTGTFALFYLLQNPGDAAATATIRYLLPAPRPPIERSYTLPPHSRTTIGINGQGPELAATDVSASITTTQPILVERAMYRTVAGQIFAAGHASAGVTAAATHWFLAEGATGPFFDLFILLANPSPADATVEIRYLLPGGTVLTKTYGVAAESRHTIWVDGEEFPGLGRLLENVSVSSAITATNAVPIVVERSMWFPGPAITADFWSEAHNSAGATATATRWALADGEAGDRRNTQTFVLIANTSPTAGRVRLRILPESPAPPTATPLTLTLDLPANSRTTVPLHDQAALRGQRFGVVVESIDTTPLADLVVERAMYWDSGGVTWAAGTNLLATPVP